MSQSKLVAQAIVAYLDEQERQLEKICVAPADAKAGRVFPDGEVTRWLDSWGTEHELPPPRSGSSGRQDAISYRGLDQCRPNPITQATAKLFEATVGVPVTRMRKPPANSRSNVTADANSRLMKVARSCFLAVR